ncbi:MAG: Crp/Fnr family transcriptional regulator [Clostridiaceae bacterium]|nr:Crp/Fnr family transcriptional regulator [Clostridiaceae bacterium]
MAKKSFYPITYILEDSLASYRSFVLEQGPKPHSYPSGTIFSQSGEVSRYLYFLLEGIIKVSTTNQRGYVRIIGFHKDNSLFVLDGLRGNQPSIVMTEALTACTVVPISVPELHRMCDLNPQFCRDLMLYVGDVLRLMCYDAQTQSVRDTTARLASFFLLSMDSNEYKTHGCIRLSHESLASAINASHVHVSRIVAKLKADGVIATKRSRVYILDEKALRQYVSHTG